jgi:glucose/arabinose dehydrogenase
MATGILMTLALLLSGHETSQAQAPANALPGSASGYELVRAFPNVATDRPISVVIPPDGTKRLFLVLQGGRIIVLPADESGHEASTFLDISNRGLGTGEMGLLGLAFHPKFAENGKFYLNYTRTDMLRSIICEVQVSKSDPSKADVSTERILIEQPQPFTNHNSGSLIFGPDGYLYLTLGDGGNQRDPLRTAQNPFNLLGKMLRIDVNRTQAAAPTAFLRTIPSSRRRARVPKSGPPAFAIRGASTSMKTEIFGSPMSARTCGRRWTLLRKVATTVGVTARARGRL